MTKLEASRGSLPDYRLLGWTSCLGSLSAEDSHYLCWDLESECLHATAVDRCEHRLDSLFDVAFNEEICGDPSGRSSETSEHSSRAVLTQIVERLTIY